MEKANKQAKKNKQQQKTKTTKIDKAVEKKKGRDKSGVIGLYATEAEKTKQTTPPPPRPPPPPTPPPPPRSKKKKKRKRKSQQLIIIFIVTAYDYECSQHHASFYMYVWGVSVVPPHTQTNEPMKETYESQRGGGGGGTF